VAKKPDRSLGVELVQGLGVGTNGSFGVSYNVLQPSSASRRGDVFLALRYKNTPIRVIVGYA